MNPRFVLVEHTEHVEVSAPYRKKSGCIAADRVAQIDEGPPHKRLDDPHMAKVSSQAERCVADPRVNNPIPVNERDRWVAGANSPICVCPVVKQRPYAIGTVRHHRRQEREPPVAAAL